MSATDDIEGFVTVRVGPQQFGVPVLQVQDVFAPVRIDPVPLAPPEVAGSLNLRGRIVIALDMRRRLGLPPRAEGERYMSVIVEHEQELYALQVDDVGDVLWLPKAEREPPPLMLDPTWSGLCAALHRLEDALLLVLDVRKTLTLNPTTPIAA